MAEITDLGNRIKKLREFADLTQVDFASKIGISRSMLSQIETDKTIPTYDTLKKIISIFDILPTYFFDEIEQNNLSDISVYIKGGKIQNKRQLNSDSNKNEAILKSEYGNTIKNRLKFELQKEDATLYNIYRQFDESPTIVDYAQTLLSFLETIDIENPGDFLNYIDSFLTSSKNAPPTYDEYKKAMLLHLNNLLPYADSLQKLKESLNAFFITVKPIDIDNDIWMV